MQNIIWRTTTASAGTVAVEINCMQYSSWEQVGVLGDCETLVLINPGESQAVVYNTFVSCLWWGGNTTALGINFVQTGTGFSNENHWFGGRVRTNLATATLVNLTSTALANCNHNNFYSVDMETATAAYGVRFHPNSGLNLVDHCRFEGTFTVASVDDQGSFNVVRLGDTGAQLVVKDEAKGGILLSTQRNLLISERNAITGLKVVRNGAGTGSDFVTHLLDSNVAGTQNVLRLEGKHTVPSAIKLVRGYNASGEVFQVDGQGLVNITPTAPNVTAVAVNGLQVLRNRRAGWTAATGTATRTTFDTATVTTAQLAERVKALLDDLLPTAGHGLIGA
jgi:hypothetical protein